VERDPIFGLDAVTEVPGVAPGLLVPARAWDDPHQWQQAARGLAAKFRDNFAAYADEAGSAVVAAGPQG